MNRLQVLLSTYNGEKYIAEQLDSIFNQQGIRVNCLVRDDGSTDGTIKVLEEYSQHESRLKIIKGSNVGYENSFMELLRLSDDFDYYAFADQDDVWLPLKLKRAVDMLSANRESPFSLYCSNCILVNDILERTGMLHSQDTDIRPSNKLTALIQGFAHGCTMVFPKESRNLVLMYAPKQSYAHDFWIPLLHLYFGKVIYDKESYILYRQHDQNVFGNKRSFMNLLRRKYSFTREKNNFYSLLAKDLLEGYSCYLSDEEEEELGRIVGYKKNIVCFIRLLFNKNIRRNTLRGTIFIKVLILNLKF